VGRVLDRISGLSISSVRLSLAPDSIAEQVAQDYWQWWAEVQEKGEYAVLVEHLGAVLGENEAAAPSALVTRYPHSAFEPIAAAIRSTKDPVLRATLVQCLAGLQGAKVEALVRRLSVSDASVDVRVIAARVLAAYDPVAGTTAVEHEWTRLPTGSDGPRTVWSIAEYLIDCQRPSAVAAMANGLRTRSSDLVQAAIMAASQTKVVTVYPLPAPPTDPLSGSQWLAEIEDMLGTELTDSAVCDVSLSGEGYSFDNPSMSDLACFALARRFPSVYKFHAPSDEADAESERLASLAVYRSRRGHIVATNLASSGLH